MANPRLDKVKAKAKKARVAKRKAAKKAPKKNLADTFASSLGSVANVVKKRRLKKKKG